MNQLDMKSWPQISFHGQAINLPMPVLSGRAVCCQLGDRNECGECVAKREKDDAKLKAEMLDMRGLPTRAGTRGEIPEWQR